MEDDFNTANALAAIFDFIRYANASVGVNSSKQLAKTLLETLEKVCGLLGLDLSDQSAASDDASEIEALIKKRQEARANKDYKAADAIRKELSDKGVVLEDRQDGVRWSYK
jgi:cysteinyl-tRNA synthetase